MTIAVGLALQLLASTWVEAKALLLTSPVIVLLAWGGFAALRSARGRWALRAALALALALAGGVAVSDAMQYHSSNLAPTARYEELATIDARFAGRGPTLFTAVSTNTRCISCATWTSGASTSCIRRPASR